MRLTKAASWQQEVPTPEFWKKLQHILKTWAENLGFDTFIPPVFLQDRNKNKCRVTDTINNFLSLNCSVVPMSFVNNWVALLWGPTPHPCPGWCLKGRLIPGPSELCCAQWELGMSLPCVTSACWYTWGQLCLHACSTCQDSSPASPGHGWQKSVKLSRSEKSLLWQMSTSFSFEEAFSAITGRKTC